ncbi:MAG: glutaminyl-peptide cyclotransferase [Thermoguttaceae bacterium]|nr:glutaminyl-peptide cyclotransferase [Thermoguttaceae bacterium]
MPRPIPVLLLPFLFLGAVVGEEAKVEPQEPSRPPADVVLSVIDRLPHSTDAYCQGLFFERDGEGNGRLYESCGQYGKSRVQILSAETGKVLRGAKLPSKVFAEGLTVVGDEIFLLTWREGIGYVRDKKTLKEKRTFRYSIEGWGLTEDLSSDETPRPLIQSDGSSVLRWYDPPTWRKIKERTVYRQLPNGRRQTVANLNELEWIDGEIWANVYQTPYIVRIDPETGEVIGVINCQGLIPKGYENDPDRVLNGIAWDAAGERLFLTGKKWPVLYVMRVERPDGGPQAPAAEREGP